MKYGLIKGRHDLPVSDYIVNEDIKNVMDFDAIQEHCDKFIREHKNEQLLVYVTGLTPVTVALINSAVCAGAWLVLMHYDRESGKYKAQEVCTCPSRLYRLEMTGEENYFIACQKAGLQPDDEEWQEFAEIRSSKRRQKNG